MMEATQFSSGDCHELFSKQVKQGGRSFYLRVVRGKLTDEKADAIVIPVDQTIHHLKGISEEIAMKAGKKVSKKLNDWKKKNGKLDAGHSMITGGGSFPFQKIIHARAIQDQSHPKNQIYLKEALVNSLRHFKENKDISSLAIPSELGKDSGIETEIVAEILIKTSLQFIKEQGSLTSLKEIHFTNPEESICSIFEKMLLQIEDSEKPKDIPAEEEKKEPKKAEESKGSLKLAKGLKELASQVIIFGGRQFILKVVKGDVTIETTEAIVNAANSLLIHGAGLAKAIAVKAGESLQFECRKWRDKYKQLHVGEAMSTTSGFMPSKRVIHTVGPMGREQKGKNDAQLRWAAISSLKECDRQNLKSISIPAVSSGLFGFPKDRCAELIINGTLDYLNQQSGSTQIQEVHFTNIDDETCGFFVEGFKQNVIDKLKRKEELGTGGYNDKEKGIYSDLSPVSIPFKKKGGGPAPKPKTGKGGVSYVKKGGK